MDLDPGHELSLRFTDFPNKEAFSNYFSSFLQTLNELFRDQEIYNILSLVNSSDMGFQRHEFLKA